MKLKKNVNINSVIARLETLQQEASVLIKGFRDAMTYLDDPKLGIPELNYKIDEDIGRFNNTYERIIDLIKGL